LRTLSRAVRDSFAYMVRSAVSMLEAPGPDIDAINLRRLLIRLEQRILVPGPDSVVLLSSFERGKIAQNVEYARTLLLRLEHNTPNIKIQARKHAQQAELARHRALIKRFTERLYDLDRQDDEDDAGDVNQEEDIIKEYFAPEATAVKSSHSRGPSTSDYATFEGQGIRARNAKSTVAASKNSGTSGPTTALADELFGQNSQSLRPGSAPDNMSAERQLEHQDSLQADLTSLLVKQAQQLKLGSLEFQRTLVEDDEVRARAEGTISKSADSLDVASRSMKTLRRMSEGRWWWQRYIMFILIFVLWFVAFGIVFFTPKLRF